MYLIQGEKKRYIQMKRALFLIGASLLMVSLAGCGSKSASTDSTTKETSATTTTSSSKKETKTTNRTIDYVVKNWGKSEETVQEFEQIYAGKSDEDRLLKIKNGGLIGGSGNSTSDSGSVTILDENGNEKEKYTNIKDDPNSATIKELREALQEHLAEKIISKKAAIASIEEKLQIKNPSDFTFTAMEEKDDYFIIKVISNELKDNGGTGTVGIYKVDRRTVQEVVYKNGKYLPLDD
jgi:ABC-type Fe3+-hydroxamate transport system substrate-binding protein